MKLIIAGSRYGVSQKFFDDCLNQFIKDHEVSEIVSGCSAGVDTQAINWAIYNNIKLKEFPADWAKLGRKAGPIRNKQMAEYGDFLIAFFNKDALNLGTKNMILQINILKKPLIIYDERLFEDKRGKLLPNKQKVKQKFLKLV